jgi:rod shape-determining protein MreD
MVYYVVMPVFSMLLIVFQRTLLNLLFGGKITLEISLVLVIYAGFRFGIVRGGLLAFFLGFLLDVVSGTTPGLYTFIYTLIFFFSYLLSMRVYAERMILIMGVTFICAMLEGCIVLLVYQLVYGLDVFYNLLKIFLPQALVAGVLSPAVFAVFNRVERVVDVGKA